LPITLVMKMWSLPSKIIYHWVLVQYKLCGMIDRFVMLLKSFELLAYWQIVKDRRYPIGFNVKGRGME